VVRFRAAIVGLSSNLKNFDTMALINFSFGHYEAHAYWPFGMVL
jgi:hypothetical protein